MLSKMKVKQKRKLTDAPSTIKMCGHWLSKCVPSWETWCDFKDFLYSARHSSACFPSETLILMLECDVKVYSILLVSVSSNLLNGISTAASLVLSNSRSTLENVVSK